MSQYFAAMFRRRPNDGWFRVGRYDATTIDILCALAIASMFLYAISPSLFGRLVFFPVFVREEFEIWRIVTWPIATPPNLFALIGVAFFWSFGQQVEGLMGRAKFVTWVAAVTITPAVVVTIGSIFVDGLDFFSGNRVVVLGLSTLFLCAIWLYAATYPQVRFFDVVPLWVVAGVFTMLNVLSFSGDRLGGMLLFFLVAIGTALSVGRSLGFATAWPIPHIPLGDTGGGRSRRTRRVRPAPGPRSSRSEPTRKVVEGPWRSNDTPPPSGPPVRPPASKEDEAELDGLLDKIGSQGMDALSSEEKRRLNELSNRLRRR